MSTNAIFWGLDYLEESVSLPDNQMVHLMTTVSLKGSFSCAITKQ